MSEEIRSCHKIDFILLSVLGLGSTFYVLGLSGHFTIQVPASYVCVEKHSHRKQMTLQNEINIQKIIFISIKKGGWFCFVEATTEG